MKPSEEFIEKFQRIYFEEFNEQISKEEAYEKFLRLVNLLRVILRPGVRRDQDRNHSDPVSYEFDQIPQNGKLENHL